MIETIIESAWFWLIILLLAIWELVWKGIALWRAGRNNHLAWYICILVLNTAGILPLVYVLFFSKSKKQTKKTKK